MKADKKLYFLGFVLLWISLASCDRKTKPLFILKKPEHTGIHFNNRIEDNDSLNIITFEYIYNGGGVAIADVNNDGLQDIFFTGNLTEGQLYLNRGGLKFEEVTKASLIHNSGRWTTGIAVVDINKDGWKDFYVCASMRADANKRKNMLFVHQGIDKKGIPRFEEQAAAYGIDDDGYSMHAGFFDYDNDGDLDLYVLNNKLFQQSPNRYRPKIKDGTAENSDRLYKNNGDGTFTDVSVASGISIEGFGLGLGFSDINKDGYPDIYISNDYLSNDILYINHGDGTFSDQIETYLRHQSHFSMGNDIADINNDGFSDIVTLDMLPEDNERIKTTISNKSYTTYINNKRYGYQHQYMRNMLHLSNGKMDTIGMMPFSEIGLLAGVHQTDWSWSPLLIDVDNDGDRDLMITNGFPKDITDKDFADYRVDVEKVASIPQLLYALPVVKVSNYAFENNADLTFSDATKQWGLYHASFSNGAAYADLDNDGDLDYVVNNINDPAFVYENTLNGANDIVNDHGHYLRLRLKGSPANPDGIGAKITLKTAPSEFQFHEHFLCRGYLSSVENRIHFGLDSVTTVEELTIIWPDGKSQQLFNIPSDQLITIDHKEATFPPSIPKKTESRYLYPITAQTGIDYTHTEKDQIDFNLQPTIPHKFSQNGPGIAVGDIDGDLLEDFIIGGSAEQYMRVFLQHKDGTFYSPEYSFDQKVPGEPQGILLFDVEQDGDLDLYVIKGSLENKPNAMDYQDLIYLNNGKGYFTLQSNALPEFRNSGSCVRAADFDRDGDLDLFVGGRVVPGSYPLCPKSYLLRNDGGIFSDVTTQWQPELKNVGMVTDALWTDIDNDDKLDLIVVGEFMSIAVYKNEGRQFKRLKNNGIEDYSGWWNSITSGDFDNDGDTDYMVGNLGINNPYHASKNYPVVMYADDFDGNGSVDPIMGSYVKATMASKERKLFPVHFWNELNAQSIKFRKMFDSYKQYSAATLETLLSEEERNRAMYLKANHMASSYVENLGAGKFRMHILPLSAQLSPAKGMISGYFTDDIHLDVLIIGNAYENEVFTGTYDASIGILLKGDGKGHFSSVPVQKSGFFVEGDARALAKIYLKNEQQAVIATQNLNKLKVFGTSRNRDQSVNIQASDIYASIVFNSGLK